MGNRSAILDCGDFQANGLQSANRGFATRTRTLYADFDFAHSMSHRLTSCIICNLLSSERCALAGTLESHAASTGPAEDVALHVRDGHERIVESSQDVCDADTNILSAFGTN